jgi:uncharacterized protein DUF6445
MASTILVVDDFLSDPDIARHDALKASFVRRETRGFHYSEARPLHLFSGRGREAILRLIGQDFRPTYLESRYVAETDQDECATRRSVWVHFDRCTWVGVVYLTLPKHCRGGTSFFRHRNTGFRRWEEMLTAMQGGKHHEFPSTDPDQWDSWTTLEMKYNRLVLFDSRQFHQAAGYFGDQLENCRLCQHFAFEELSDLEILTRWKANLREGGKHDTKTSQVDKTRPTIHSNR